MFRLHLQQVQEFVKFSSLEPREHFVLLCRHSVWGHVELTVKKTVTGRGPATWRMWQIDWSQPVIGVRGCLREIWSFYGFPISNVS